MIDLHCHILPGVDDGPATIEESIELARATTACGTRTVVATSHVNWRYPNDHETLARLTGELNERLRAEGLELEVLTGAEIATTYAIDVGAAQLSRLGLGGSACVLIEPPFTPVAVNLDLLLLNLQAAGLRVLLAHPERCPAFHRDPEMLESLLAAGALTSITAGSLVGRFGGEVRRFALELVHRGMVHNVASDAHDHLRRRPGIKHELEQSGLGPLADWLAQEVPSALLSGREIPPRPALPSPKGRSPQRPRWLARKKLRRAS